MTPQQPTQPMQEWKKDFIKRFANPTAKFLGNDFAEYPKANIKDALDFIEQLLSQQRKEFIKEIGEEIENMRPNKPYPNASNNYQKELDDEDKELDKILQEILKAIKKVREKIKL